MDEALEAVHAQELGIRNFQEISDGQRQRVLLARAICQEPEVMILDEPTSYLDIRHKLELLAILRKMAKENGITVIMSLHEIDLAQKYRIRLSVSKATGLPNLVIRKKYSRKQQFVIFMKSTMVITIRYSEVWNFQSRKENRKFWYYLPVNRNPGLQKTSESRDSICRRNPLSGRERLSAGTAAGIRDHQRRAI